MNRQSVLIDKMTEYFSNDPKRIQHFIKVYAFAKTIGELENIDEDTLFILETASIVHDIGIKPSELKYGNCNGKNQEKEGSVPAREILSCLGYNDRVIDRVCFLVSHHHTYSNIDGIDWQILIESDFLVNAYEDDMEKETVQNVYDKLFRTESGKNICRTMFGLK
jgi:hypothetical protein